MQALKLILTARRARLSIYPSQHNITYDVISGLGGNQAAECKNDYLWLLARRYYY